jgi:uncharacterized membrane protein YdjX (TVP38/TMEM64 family)
MSRSVPARLLVLFLVVLAIAIFYFTGLSERFSWQSIRDNLHFWKQTSLDHFWLTLLGFFLLYVLLTALSIPAAALLSLLAGALFGLVVGVAVTSTAAACGATLAFLSSRYVLRDWVRQRFGQRFADFDQGVEREGMWYLLTLRLIPAIPFFLINLGMGLTSMPARTFLLVSWLGMLPGSIVYVNAGRAMGEIEKPSDVLSLGVILSFAALALLPLALRWLLRKLSPAAPKAN